MKWRNNKKIIRQVLKRSGAYKVLLAYLILFFMTAVLLQLFEPEISSLGDSLWYCFAVATTVGFGDFAAGSLFGRILTLVLSMYSIIVIAIITAVITNFFIEAAKMRTNESAAAFMDDLEHLPELSKEELIQLSERVKRWTKKQ